MLISLIIPCYNCEKTLEVTINSILKQTYTNFEIILVNDGSSDCTDYICKRLVETDHRIKYYTIINGGPSKARNYGLKKALGQYIMFIDSDDYIDSDTISKLVDECNKKDYEIIFFGNTNEKLSKTDFIITGINSLKKKEILSNSKLKEEFISLHNERYLYPVWNKLYKKSFIEKSRAIFPEGINYSEDFIFNLMLYRKLNKALIIEDTLYHYVSYGEASLTTTFNYNRFKESIDIYNISEPIIKEWNMQYLNIHQNKLIYDVSVCINDLFNPDCMLNKREKKIYIKNIINNRVLRKIIYEIEPLNLRCWVIVLLLKFRLKLLLLLSGRVARLKVK